MSCKYNNSMYTTALKELDCPIIQTEDEYLEEQIHEHIFEEDMGLQHIRSFDMIEKEQLSELIKNESKRM